MKNLRSIIKDLEDLEPVLEQVANVARRLGAKP